MFRYVKSVFRACFLILRLSSSFDQWPRAHISHVTFTIRLLIEYGSCKFEPMYEYHRSVKRKRALVKNR